MNAWATMCASPVEPCFERQYVSAVLAFSTQYGTGDSNWGACNIVGQPRVYPTTGDNPKAWAPQQYTGKVSVPLCRSLVFEGLDVSLDDLGYLND